MVAPTATSTSFKMPGNPISLLFSATLWRSAGLLFSSFILGTLWFCLFTSLISTGIGTLVIWIGLPILGGTVVLWKGVAQTERARMAALLGITIAPPYRALPKDTLWKRFLALLADPAVWRDFSYLYLLFPLGIIEFVVFTVGLATPLGMIAMPFYYQYAHPQLWTGDSIFGPGLTIDTLPKALIAAGVGVVLLFLFQYAIVGMARMHGALANALLGMTFAQRAAALQADRERIMNATLLERRRIERDLHDGAQQQLVSLALDLGMAREKMADQPGDAQELVAEAHEKAKRAMSDLRDLVRGIHPAILTDRGLDAALSALAANSLVPVAVQVDLPRRLPEAVETSAYYLVAEALTNIAKYSQATVASVQVHEEHNRLLIDIMDNGVGGAKMIADGGLAGLVDRFAVLGGRLTLDSPAGGPTHLHGELPCTSSSLKMRCCCGQG